MMQHYSLHHNNGEKAEEHRPECDRRCCVRWLDLL